MSHVQDWNARRFLPILLVPILLMLLTTISVLPVAADGTTYYVDAGASGSATGSSWANAYTNLQDALQVATSGDEIWVAKGVYYPDVGGGKTDNDENASFVIPSGVKLYGGFPSGGDGEGPRDWRLNKTILSGDIGQDDTAAEDGVVVDVAGISGANSNHVVYLGGTAETGVVITDTTIIDGFVITAGQSNSAEGRFINEGFGGGLYCYGGEAGECSPTVMNVTFSGNMARSGGAMYNDGKGGISSPSLTNVTFRGNSASGYGGAMYNDGKGGISNPSFTNVTFDGNSAEWGGAMYNDGVEGTSSPSLTNAIFSGNLATTSGGAMYNDASNADSSNGASSPSLVNVTFNGNAATWGGAMYNDATPSGTSSPSLTNVILWQNSAPNGASLFNSNATAAISHSIVENGAESIVGEGAHSVMYDDTNSASDPLFVQPVDPANAPTTSGDLRLQAGSPAINVGDNSAVPSSGIATDLDGNLRIVGGTVDMGAYEFADNHNNYLYFNGANQHAEFTAPPNLPSGSAPRTIAFWMRSNLREDAYQNHESIVELGAQTHDGSAFGIFTQRLSGETELCFWGHNADKCNLAIIPDDQWHFVAITYEEPYLTTYLDGEWKSSHEIITTIGGQRLNTEVDKGFIGGFPPRGWYFNGGVKNLSIWDSVRTEFQIRQDMASYPKINGNEPGLVAYYPLNEGGGSTFVDLRGASTGTLIDGNSWSRPIDNNPSLTSEGIWFVIQNKSDVDEDYDIPAQRQALKAENDGRVVIETIPLTGNYDEFLWSVQSLPDGKYKLINKKTGVGKALDSSQSDLVMADSGDSSGQAWTLSLSNQADMGLNVYALSNDLITNAQRISYSQDQVVVSASDPASANQAWVFQPMELVLGYHIPSRQPIAQPFTKILSLDKGNTLYATHSTSDWAVLNAHNIYNNIMNAFADPNTVPQPQAKKTFYLISRHDFQPCYYAPIAASPTLLCKRDNDWRGWSGDETFFTEEMMSRVGVAMRGPRDTSYREFEQVVHEFGHTLDGQYFSSKKITEEKWPKAWASPVEWYPWQVQYWFNSAQSAGANQNRDFLKKNDKAVYDYIATMFSDTNTWLPPRKLRDLETRPQYTFYTPGTFITAGGEEYKIFSDNGAKYQMQLQEDGDMVISNADGRVWSTFKNLNAPMQEVKGIYFKNGQLYFTKTADQSEADKWIEVGNPGILETVHLYDEQESITARLRINPNPGATDFLEVINITPGKGETAPALLWSSYVHWSYDDDDEGPSEWGKLDLAYATCATGMSQSPIDLTGAGAQDMTNIVFDYLPTKMHLENTGHSIQVNYDAGSYIEVDGERYGLKQFHFHSPSENTMDGQPFPIEMHLVHKNRTDQLAVVAVFLNAGAHNAVLQPVWGHMPDTKGKREVNAKINANDLLPSVQTTYRYSGSLTTPPCTEEVSWFVMNTPIEVSNEQITAFQSFYDHNNRPLQPLNGRDLTVDSTP